MQARFSVPRVVKCKLTDKQVWHTHHSGTASSLDKWGKSRSLILFVSEQTWHLVTGSSMFINATMTEAEASRRDDTWHQTLIQSSDSTDTVN